MSGLTWGAVKSSVGGPDHFGVLFELWMVLGRVLSLMSSLYAFPLSPSDNAHPGVFFVFFFARIPCHLSTQV